MALRNIRCALLLPWMLIQPPRPCLFSNQRQENEKFITLTSSRKEISALAIFHTSEADRRLSIVWNVFVLYFVVLLAPFVCWCPGSFRARITATVTALARLMNPGWLGNCTTHGGSNSLQLSCNLFWCLMGEMSVRVLFESLWERDYVEFLHFNERIILE